MNAKKLLALMLVVVMVLGVFAGCQQEKPQGTTTKPTAAPTQGTTAPTEPQLVVETFEGDFIYKDSVSVLSTNWNPHTYQGADQSYPLDFITSSLYTFMYNDELNPVEGKDAFEGYVIVPEMAADHPVDVTEKVKAEHPEYNIPESATTGFAYTIALNPNATFSNGKPINAETYVESMRRLLDPKLLNYRAEDTYTGSLVIAGAKAYANGGHVVYNDSLAKWTLADLTKGEDGQYVNPDGNKMYIALEVALDWLSGNSLAAYVNAYGAQYFDVTNWEALNALATDGVIPLTDENLELFAPVVTGNPAWGETEAELPNYFAWGFGYPEVEFEGTVGLYASGEYELTLVLENALSGFYLYYNIGILSLPLVDIELYDACLSESDGVWSSTYNTSLDTTVSYGPYMISEYQTDKAMRFVRNENWFGYTDGKHIYIDPEDGLCYPMYQTTEIYTQVVAESSTTKLMFLKGELMGYGLQSEDFAQYRNSDYVYETPATTIFFLVLNGHKSAIMEREAAEDFDKATTDLETMTLDSFRRALAISYDKELFASTVSPSRSATYAAIGNLYVYDVDSGARYRDTDQAKQILCDVYSVDTSKYATLDDAVASITGYDPETAKVLFTQAYNEAIEAGYITDADNDGKSDQTVTMMYSLSADSDFMTTTINYLNEKLGEVLVGTPFEGKVLFTKSAPLGDPAWSDQLKAGQTDVCLCGWQGSALDPYSITDLYVNPAKAYDAQWFDATTVELTLNVNVAGVDAKEMKDVTMTMKQWSDCLNGVTVTIDGVEYNFGDGQTDVDTRLTILAGIEGAILRTYNYLPMLQNASMALLSQQVYYVVEEYSPVMGRGGIAYMKYNYNETEWKDYVAAQNGELKY